MKFENSFDLHASPASSSVVPAAVSDADGETGGAALPDISTEDRSSVSEPSQPDEQASTEAASTSAPESTTLNNETESTTEKREYPTNTEFDILRSGVYTIVGTITNEGEDLHVNISCSTDDQIYFTTEIDSMELGLYVKGKKTYIYAPDAKKYLKMNSAVAKLLSMDPQTFIEMTEGLGFDRLPTLNNAISVEDAKIGGTACEKYKFISDTGDQTIFAYLNGTKLLRLEYIDANGNISTSISFESVSAGFPKMPPDGFEEIGYIEFFKLIADGM